MRLTWFSIAVVLSAAAAAVCLRAPAGMRPLERAEAFRPSRHAAPPEDVEALNTGGVRRVPESLAGAMLPDDRPAVVMFLKAGCGCSEDFARVFSMLATRIVSRASCLAVIEAAAGDADAFLEATGLSTPHLVQSDAALAARWGVTKAGCVALVRPDGTVEAIWPGISRQGFRDLADRLGDADLLPPETLSALPGAATAGCPLLSAALVAVPTVLRSLR